MKPIRGDYQFVALHHGSPAQKQWHRNRHLLMKYLKFFTKRDTVLDAGCGSGNVLFDIAPLIKSVKGIDNNPECIAFIKGFIKINKYKNVTVDLDNLLNMKTKGKFSKIILTEVIEHFSEKECKIILKKLQSLLLPKGQILITTPNYKSLWTVEEKLIDIFHLSPTLWGEQHKIKFTSDNLTTLLQSQGFTIKKMGTLNFLSPFIRIFNTKLADRLAMYEIKHSHFGSLLYAVVTV